VTITVHGNKHTILIAILQAYQG